MPLLILGVGVAAICWLRWGRLNRCRPCGAELPSHAALQRHIKLYHHE